MELTAVLTTLNDYNSLTRALLSLEGEADSAVVLVPEDGRSHYIEAACPIPCTVKEGELPGLAATRNRGAEIADGDVVAFLDDDVVVEDGWGEALKIAFRGGARAAGGPAVPAWETSRPAFLPERWDWLVGCGPYHDTRTVVRNTYGCNIAFDADTFEELGGFDESYGFDGDLGQGEEAELCGRMADEFGCGTEYMPDAIVHHHVPATKAAPRRLLKRCWAQGRTKARMGVGDEEEDFLVEAVLYALKEKPMGTLGSFAYLGATGFGYLSERIRQY